MGKRQALLIGVSKYQSNAIENLQIIPNDLDILSSSLKSSGFEVEIVGGESNEGTGRSAILQRLRDTCRRAKDIETLLLYFSGHGIHYGGQDYLVPADADVSDPNYLSDYLVSTELGPVVDQCPAQTILLVVDACREGVKLESKAIGLSQWSRGERRKAMKRCLFLIFSCGPGQYSQYLSGDRGFSLFTHAFAEVLSSQHPACQVDTVLKATQKRLNELILEYRKAPQEIRVTYESTATDNQTLRVICDGTLPTPKVQQNTFEKRIPVGVPFQVPPLPSYYVDRPATRQRLKCALLEDEPYNNSSKGTLVVSAIYGLGGIGKSVLAAALALDPEVQKKFPDGVLWVTLGQQPEVLAFLSNWIQALRDFDYKPTTIEAASTHLRSLLHKKRILLVVDDAWAAEAVEPFRVGGSGCQVLVTTRETRVPGAYRVDLEQMEPEEAISLLQNYLRQALTVTERQAALLFAEAVGYLPLALELAAAQIQEGWTWSELLSAFEEEVAHLEVLDAPDLKEVITEKSRKQRSLKASFHLSLKRLSSEFSRRFAEMGVLPEDASISAKVMATMWNISVEEAKRTLRELRRRSFLLDGVAKEGESTYRLHDLMHDIAQSLLQETVGLREAHRQVCNLYRTQGKKWWKLSEDGYIHAYLTWHLEQAGLLTEIHELLQANDNTGKNAWFEECNRVGQPAIFVQDIARGWRLAETLWKHEPKRAIVLQVRYALTVTTLNSLVDKIPPGLVVCLVKHSLWSIEQAWPYVERMKDENNRANSIKALAPYIPISLIHRALSTLESIEAEHRRAEVLVRLSQFLPLKKEISQELIAKFLNLNNTIQFKYSRAQVLTNLFLYDKSLSKKVLEAINQITIPWRRNELLEVMNSKTFENTKFMRKNALTQSSSEASSYLKTFIKEQNSESETDALKEALENSFVVNRKGSKEDYKDYLYYLKCCLIYSYIKSDNLSLNSRLFYEGISTTSLAFGVEALERILSLLSEKTMKSVSKDISYVEEYLLRLPPNETPLKYQDEITPKSSVLEHPKENTLLEQRICELQLIRLEKERFKELTNLRRTFLLGGNTSGLDEGLSIQILCIIDEFKLEYHRDKAIDDFLPYLSLSTCSFSAWKPLLHLLANSTRPKFFHKYLPKLTSTLQKLGGDSVIEDIYDVAQEVCSQWK